MADFIETPRRSEPERLGNNLTSQVFEEQIATRSRASRLLEVGVASSSSGGSRSTESASLEQRSFPKAGSLTTTSSLPGFLDSEHRWAFLSGGKDQVGRLIQNPEYSLSATLGVIGIASQSKLIPKPAAWSMLAGAAGLLLIDELKEPVSQVWSSNSNKNTLDLAFRSGSTATKIAALGVAPFLLGRSNLSRFKPF